MHVKEGTLPDPVYDFPPISLPVGQEQTVSFSVSPVDVDIRDRKAPAFTIENSKIATVSAGILTALGEGTTKCTVTTVSGKEFSTTVTVTPAVELTGLALKDLTIQEGTEQPMAPTFTPEGTTQRMLSWFSDNPDVAAVDYQGRLYARKPGKATITALSWARKLQTSATVTVTDHKLPAEEGGGEGGEGGEGGGEGGSTQGGDSSPVPTPVDGGQSPAPTLSPNPVSDILTISGLPPASAVSIYTPMGQLAYSALLPEDSRLDVHALPPGLYILRAGPATLRFIKQ